MSIPAIIVLTTGGILVAILFTGAKRGIAPIAAVTIIGYALTTTYNLTYNPHFMMWLCNFTALIGIILLFRFNQLLFEMLFYFAWTGDLLTLFLLDSQTIPDMSIYPATWVGYWFKHIGPMALSIFFVTVGRRRLRKSAATRVFGLMLIYIALMFFYDLIFDQNIMDLMEATIPIEKLFGPWPIYIIINLLIGAVWYGTIHLTTQKLDIVHIEKNIT